MRDGNPHAHTSFMPHDAEVFTFRKILWGMETQRISFYAQNRTQGNSLERSYEGWKHPLADRDGADPHFCLERSYEGWKRLWLAEANASACWPCLERSYEGWKRGRLNTFPILFSRSSSLVGCFVSSSSRTRGTRGSYKLSENCRNLRQIYHSGWASKIH